MEFSPAAPLARHLWVSIHPYEFGEPIRPETAYCSQHDLRKYIRIYAIGDERVSDVLGAHY